MKKFFLLSILLPFGAFAQDLSTEVVVDRTVAVELPEASPLAGVGPALSLPMRSDAALRISDYTMSTDFEPSVARNSPLSTPVSRLQLRIAVLLGLVISRHTTSTPASAIRFSTPMLINSGLPRLSKAHHGTVLVARMSNLL